MQKLKFYIEYILLKSVQVLISSLPEKMAYHLGVFLGKVYFAIDKKHRLIAQENIEQSNIVTDRLMIDRLIRSTYENLTLTLIEFIRMSGKNPAWFDKNVVIEGEENLKKAVDSGKGVIVLMSHFGNWEHISHFMSYWVKKNKKDKALYAVARPMKNPLTEKIIFSLRSSAAVKFLPKKNVLPALIQVLRDKQMVGILGDQNSGKEGIFMDFLGREASVNPSPVIMAMKTDSIILPFFSVREGVFKHKMIFEEIIEIEKQGDFQLDVYNNLAKCTSVVESYIHRYPAQWLWLHRRWKTKKEDVSRLRFRTVYDKIKKEEKSDDK